MRHGSCLFDKTEMNKKMFTITEFLPADRRARASIRAQRQLATNAANLSPAQRRA
jgi:hypothetical protein